MRLFILSLMALIFSIALVSCDQLSDKNAAENVSIYDYQRPGGPRDQADPPTPPLRETFEGAPQISLFPRVGDFKPEPDDEHFPYWRTFIDHFNKVSGLMQDNSRENRFWGFRGINTIDSVAFFSPVAVEPDTSYQISFKIRADLPEGTRTGLGILEFDSFAWIGEQYTEKMTKEHQLRSKIGIELNGKFDWKNEEFTLTTGPKTHMIHLVFFLDGKPGRNPVLIDDIEIRKTEG